MAMFTDASALLGAAPGVPLFSSSQAALPETIPLRSASNLATPTSSEASVGSLSGRKTTWWQKAGVAALSAVGAATSLAFMIKDYVGGKSDPLVQAAAGIGLGVSSIGILRAIAPEETRRVITNTVKRSIFPVFFTATELWYMLNKYEISSQIYFSLFNSLTGALVFDDIIQLITMEQKGHQEVEKTLEMVEGDAKSTCRTVLNHTAMLVAGVAMLATGFSCGSDNLRSNLKTAGAVLCSYFAGGVSANLAWKYVDTLSKKHKIDPLRPTDPPVNLRIANAVVRFFQFGTPQLFAIAITPSNPYATAVAGLLYGIEGQLTRTAFQYFPHPDDETSALQRANAIWVKRKGWIGFNSIFLLLFSAWYIAGDAVDNGRDRGAISAMFGTFLATSIANGAIDLKWQPQRGKIMNSLYYNFLIHAPWAAIYLYSQTKFVANITFFNSESSWVKYMFGLGALAAYGACLGSDCWKTMRKDVPEEEFTSTIAKSILTWVTFNYAFGNILKK